MLQAIRAPSGLELGLRLSLPRWWVGEPPLTYDTFSVLPSVIRLLPSWLALEDASKCSFYFGSYSDPSPQDLSVLSVSRKLALPRLAVRFTGQELLQLGSGEGLASSPSGL